MSTVDNALVALDAAVWNPEVGFWEWHVPTDTLRWLNDWYARCGFAACDGPDHIRKLFDILDPAHVGRVTEAFRLHRDGARERYEVDYRLRTTGGAWRWVAQRARIVERDAAGAPVRMVGLSFDIDERMRLEDAVELERQRFLSAAASVPSWIILSDRDGRIEFANRAIGGVLPAELRGRNPEEFVGPEEVARFRRAFETAIAAREVQCYTSVHDGGRRVLENRLAPIVVADEVVGVASNVIDVTARLALERAALESKGREDRRFGTDLLEGLGQELTGVALTLKSLVRSAEASGEPLARDLGEALAYVNGAIARARRLARGVAPAAREQGGLARALEDLRRDAVEGAPQVSVRVDAHAARDLEPLLAEHLYRNAEEAVANALRHARARSVRVEFRPGAAAGALRLVVEDDGCGIHPDAEHGPGLGLKLMRYRMETVGGLFRAVPREGGGTRITCDCPRRGALGAAAAS